MQKPVRRGERREDRTPVVDGVRIAAGHEAVAHLETPDAAAGSGVDEADAALCAGRGARNRIVVVAVATIDDGVAFLQQRLQRRHRAVGDLSRRHHDPDAAWLVELRDELVEAPRRRCAGALDTGAGLWVRVVRDDRVIAITAESMHHVGAHPAEPDKADLHGGGSSWGGWSASRAGCADGISEACEPRIEVAGDVNANHPPAVVA